jgi:hypothetical protein
MARSRFGGTPYLSVQRSRTDQYGPEPPAFDYAEEDEVLAGLQ